jgi:predicted nucleotidyltransferase
MNDFDRILGAIRAAEVSFVIIGGVAATIHGSARLTTDVDIVYERSKPNIERLVDALSPLNPYLRGVPPGLPFRFDVETVRRGLNFTLITDAGPVDVLGEITGIGDYERVLAVSEEVSLFGSSYRCINIDALIVSKRAAGRPKDLEAVAELELIREEKAAADSTNDV